MKILSLTTISLSSMMIISNSNLMLMWMMLEINSMFFISFMKKKKETDNMLKYFLIQILGSIPLILSIVMNQFFLINMFLESMLILISMLIKMGAAPFHIWIIQMSKKMDWNPFLILLSIQKLAPITILGLISKSFFLLMMVIINSTFGMISIFSSNKLKLIIIFSSISHLSWIIAGEMMSKKSSMIYLLVYSMMILIVITPLKKNKTENINSQEKMNKNSPLMLSMISLGGVPPSVGFFPKMMTIFLLTKSLKKTLLMSFFLLTSSMISIISYLRLLMKTMTKSKKKGKFKILKSNLIIHKTQIIFMPMMILIMPI